MTVPGNILRNPFHPSWMRKVPRHSRSRSLSTFWTQVPHAGTGPASLLIRTHRCPLILSGGQFVCHSEIKYPSGHAYALVKLAQDNIFLHVGEYLRRRGGSFNNPCRFHNVSVSMSTREIFLALFTRGTRPGIIPSGRGSPALSHIDKRVECKQTAALVVQSGM